MEKAKALFRWTGMLAIVAGVLVYGMGVQGVEKPAPVSGELRADIIVIDGLKAFGKLDRPPVTFLHEAHTEALKKKEKDCKACHLVEKDRAVLAEQEGLSVRFKRLKDTSREAVMDIYHADCISCHKEMDGAGEKTGPVEVCGDCHREGAPVVSNRQVLVMDKSLHYRHVEGTKDASGKEKCDACHHEYDEIAKKVYYVKEKEGSCRYCHGEKAEKEKMSMREASHLSCVNCHRKTLAEKKNPDQKVGAITCSGCHDPLQQEKIKKIADVPRIKRKQPDFILLQPEKKVVAEAKKDAKALKMDPVPFDHKSHEGYKETCRSCHHAKLDSCAEKCHTVEGVKDGNYIKLAQAMHDMDSEHSCMGCHGVQQKQPECAGCHALMPRFFNQETAACQSCHQKAPMNVDQMKPEAIAKVLLDSRTFNQTTYKQEDIPEKVVIKVLADEYEPAEFPHRKIVQTLVKGLRDNKLATYFHREEGTLCQGCHHKSPVSKEPPRCWSCHGKPFDANAILRPGMKGAYHQQCIGCHQEMGLEKPKATDCAVCHKEKKKKTY